MPRMLGPALSLAALLTVACGDSDFPDIFRPDRSLREQLEGWGVGSIPPAPRQDPALVALGRALFFDKVLSGNRDVSCATCHDPLAFLSDRLTLSIGTGGSGRMATRTLGAERELVPRHSPALFNTGRANFYLFWDGRLQQFEFDSFVVLPESLIVSGAPNILAAQASLPVLNRVEMRGNAGDLDVLGDRNELADIADEEPEKIWQAIVRRLLAIPEYEAMFAAAFPGVPADSLRFGHAAEAIAAFELETFEATDSPVDRYVAGDDDALSDEAIRGGELFVGDGTCISCHGGPFFGGDVFANVGAPQVGPGVGAEAPLDLGRGRLEGFDFYRFAFRAPSLRNVALTPPYMHSGAYPTLQAVVEHYSDVPRAIREYDTSQLPAALRESYHGDAGTLQALQSSLSPQLREPFDFSDGQKRDLVAFLMSLTDPSSRNMWQIVPSSVPSGLPIF